MHHIITTLKGRLTQEIKLFYHTRIKETYQRNKGLRYKVNKKLPRITSHLGWNVLLKSHTLVNQFGADVLLIICAVVVFDAPALLC